MVKHTEAIRWTLSTNCLSVFDHFVGLALKGLMISKLNLVFECKILHINLISPSTTGLIH